MRAAAEAGVGEAWLELTLGAESFAAPVLELTKGSLRVALSGQAALPLRTGSTLGGTRLARRSGSTRVLRLLTVAETSTRAGEERAVRLVAADDETRAALWLSIEEAANGWGARTGIQPTLAQMPRIPERGVYTEAARLARLAFARKHTGAPLFALQETTLCPERLTGNIENLVGSVEVPVGIAGPLFFRGEKARGVLYAPLAATEGALVASATRGALAVSRSGGVRTRVIRQQMMRVPLFVLSDMKGAMRFCNWVRDHVEEIREETQKVSRHARLVSVEPALMGHMVNVCFLYETGDAAGQNMTTSCTFYACQWLLGQIRHLEGVKLENFLIEGAMSGDKKVTFQAFIAGRGTRVAAECVLDRRVLGRVLHVTPEEAQRAFDRGLANSVQVGMVGFNVNVANIVAAIFTATGQDIACVHESSVGQLHLELVEDGLHASLLLPSLIVGSVGGGTHLPRQNECLQMMDCAGVGKAARLAEIVAGFCLATDLSTLCAIAGGQFAAAHDRLGRNRPVRFFAKTDMDAAFFEPGVRRVLGDPGAVLEAVEPLEPPAPGSSILTELTARKVDKLVGLFPYRLAYRTASGAAGQVEVMVKVKPLDQEVLLAAGSAAALCGPRLRSSFGRFKARTGFLGCHLRELGVYGQTDPRFRRHAPVVYDLFRDDAREAYVLVLERLRGLQLMDSADDVSGWGREQVEAALRGIAAVHAIWYRREAELLRQPWLGPVPTAAGMAEMRELWEDLAVHAAEEFPEWVSPLDLARQRALIRDLPAWWSRLESLPRTLIHNDFGPRNLGLRAEAEGFRLCAYDWELATLHVPQHDLAELLAFVLTPRTTAEEVDHYLEVHRRALEAESGRAIDPVSWRDGFALSVMDLAVNRVAFYLLAHTFRHYAFMERVLGTLARLLDLGSGR